MSTTSPILGLTLPASDGSDDFSTTPFIANWDILDGAPGVFVCTSGTHPSWGGPQIGRLIVETDTGNLLQWNGTVFVAPDYPVTLTNAVTLTNKRITKRVVVSTQSATPIVDSDTTDVVSITGLAQAITSMTTNLTGSPVAGDRLVFHITDNATGRAIAWGAKFEASGTIALPTGTTAGVLLTTEFEWNAITNAWRVLVVS